MHIDAPGTKIVDLPAGQLNPHWTRSLIASADGNKLYVAVGSATDVDVEQIDRKDPHRAAVLEVDPSAGTIQVFASGLRNATGMDWESDRLWTVVNERDHLGPRLPPDYLTAIDDGQFFGWPYAYHGKNEDPAHAGQRPDLVARSRKPDYALGAHTAPLGLAFQRTEDFAELFRSGAFISLHGSMRASPWSGPRVIFVPFANGKPAGPPLDFLTGFVADGEKRLVFGRPVGIAQVPNGDLLVADDAGDRIWAIIPDRRE